MSFLSSYKFNLLSEHYRAGLGAGQAHLKNTEGNVLVFLVDNELQLVEKRCFCGLRLRQLLNKSRYVLEQNKKRAQTSENGT